MRQKEKEKRKERETKLSEHLACDLSLVIIRSIAPCMCSLRICSNVIFPFACKASLI